MKRSNLLAALAALSMLWSAVAQCEKVYRLGVDDQVRVTVHGSPDLSAVATVAEDGTIALPTVGDVRVAGQTAREAAQGVAKALTRLSLVKSPQVALTVEQYRSQKVSVLGEVNRPGVYAIAGANTLMDLLSEAGGLGEEAGELAIVTRRGSPAGQSQAIDLAALLEGRADIPEPRLGDGDRIFVPRMDRFYIYGQVNRPGSYRLERGMTVMQALSVASGLTDKGTERGLKIRRMAGDGREQVISAELTQRIQPSDVLFVKESLF